jgi:hypothetical protein
MLVPMDDGIAFVSVKDFRQGVSPVEQSWFAFRLNIAHPEVSYYPRANQLVAEGIIKCRGLPSMGKLLTSISRFEQGCLLADGPLIEDFLQNA